MIKIKPETSPERIYLLCKTIENGNNNIDEMSEILSPYISEKNYVSEVINLAAEIGVIIKDDEKIKNIDGLQLDSLEEFAYYLVNYLYSDNDFVNTIKVILMNQDEFSNIVFDEFLTKLQNKIENGHFSKEYVLGLRFWIEFLGFGFVVTEGKSNKIIINLVNRLRYIIKFHEFTSTRIDEFVLELLTEHPELGGLFLKKENVIDECLTQAFIYLEETGYCELKYIQDSDYYINFFDGEFIKKISDISISRRQ